MAMVWMCTWVVYSVVQWCVDDDSKHGERADIGGEYVWKSVCVCMSVRVCACVCVLGCDKFLHVYLSVERRAFKFDMEGFKKIQV